MFATAARAFTGAFSLALLPGVRLGRYSATKAASHGGGEGEKTKRSIQWVLRCREKSLEVTFGGHRIAD